MNSQKLRRPLKESSESSDGLEEGVRAIVAECSKVSQAVEHIKIALDMEREFFLEYLPAHLEQRLRIEKSLDAQFDKLCAQLLIAQEARIIREKLQQATGNSQTVQSHDNAEEAVIITKQAVKEPQTELEGVDLAELDRDDNDVITKQAVKEPQTELEGLDPAELDRDDNDDDDDEWAP
jgi:hypothetical protein